MPLRNDVLQVADLGEDRNDVLQVKTYSVSGLGASKAGQQLGWKPQVQFPELVRMMVEHDISQESMGRRS